jgi:hypothetical protein
MSVILMLFVLILVCRDSCYIKGGERECIPPAAHGLTCLFILVHLQALLVDMKFEPEYYSWTNSLFIKNSEVPRIFQLTLACILQLTHYIVSNALLWGSEENLYEPHIFSAGSNNSYKFFMRPQSREFVLGIPQTLLDDEYQGLRRLWILSSEGEPGSNHFSVLDQARTFGPSVVPAFSTANTD